MDDLDIPELERITSPRHPDVRVGFAIAEVEFLHGVIARDTARMWEVCADVLADAGAHPEVFLDPVLMPSLSAERREYAVRAAAADLAVRLHVAEGTVRTWADQARVLRERAPRLWAGFREGRMPVANARVAGDLLGGLTDDEAAAFDERAVEVATTLAPARFRARARTIRAQVASESLADQRRRAAEGRRVHIENDLDGMAWLNLYLPAERAHAALAHIRAHADQLHDDRTADQQRADVAADLLTGSLGGGVRATVHVTVPISTLLGGGQPGELAGYGELDADSVRHLAADAPSFHRILTHPVSGAVLTLDRTTYRVPADLRRMLALRDRTCRFPGCGAAADRCDVDHVREWQHGGTTDAANLIHLCAHHHRLKSVTGWRPRPPDPVTAAVAWTSPTGHVERAEPPPF